MTNGVLGSLLLHAQDLGVVEQSLQDGKGAALAMACDLPRSFDSPGSLSMKKPLTTTLFRGSYKSMPRSCLVPDNRQTR